MNPYFRLALATILAVVVVGCTHLDTTPTGNPDRVLNGVVNLNSALPAGAEMIVRLIEPPLPDTPQATGTDLGAPAIPVQRTDRVLGEFRHTVAAITQQPLPFRIEYNAEDAVLRRGVNLDVRISFGGKVRLRTINAHVVTLASSPYKQDVSVQAVQ
jgi:uncharacterized lipoprotein YbaY